MSLRQPVTAYIALGANLGQPQLTLTRAMSALIALPGTQVVKQSSVYRSAPIESSGPDYLNAVVEIFTTVNAPDMLLLLQKIEQSEGRERSWRNAPRTLDLDLLLYGTATIDSPTLTVPHPRMMQRAFVLLPLAEIAPAWSAATQSLAITSQRIERLVSALLN